MSDIIEPLKHVLHYINELLNLLVTRSFSAIYWHQ